MTLKKKRAVLLVTAVLAAVGVVTYLRTRAAPTSGEIRFSGNIEATDAEVSFRIPGRVSERLVSEGETVTAGQLVARLDASDLENEVGLRRAEVRATQSVLAEALAGSRPEEIAQTSAAVEGAKARLDAVVNGSRPQEVAVAAAAVAGARAEAERLRADAERQKRLHDGGLISARENEASQTAYQVALQKVREAEERRKLVGEGPRVEEIRQARAGLAEATERHALVKKGPRREVIEQVRARLAQAQEALALAETRLGYAAVVSPLTGVVLAENTDAGEYASPGTPVVTVGDLSKVWVRAYIQESELGRVKVGQPVRVTTDSFHGKTYEGRVSFLASQAEFTPKNVQTQKERVKLVYRIKVDLPNPALELKPGMPADGTILLAESR